MVAEWGGWREGWTGSLGLVDANYYICLDITYGMDKQGPTV